MEDKLTKIPAYVVNEGMKEITLTLGELTDDEREIILKRMPHQLLQRLKIKE